MEHKSDCKDTTCFPIILCSNHQYFICSYQDPALDLNCSDCRNIFISKSICCYHYGLTLKKDCAKNPRCPYRHLYCTQCLKFLASNHRNIECDFCKLFYVPTALFIKKNCVFCDKESELLQICENHKLCSECMYLVTGNLETYSILLKCTKCYYHFSRKSVNSGQIMRKCYKCQNEGKIINPSCHENHEYCENCIEKMNECKLCENYFKPHLSNYCALCKVISVEYLNNGLFCLFHKYCNECLKILESTTYNYKQVKCDICISYFKSNQITTLKLNASNTGSDSRDISKAQHITELTAFIQTHEICQDCKSNCPVLECHHVFCKSCNIRKLYTLFHVFIQNLIAGNISYLTTENFKLECIKVGCYNSCFIPLIDFSETLQDILTQYSAYYHHNFIRHYSLFFEGFQMKFTICNSCRRTVGGIIGPICFYCTKIYI